MRFCFHLTSYAQRNFLIFLMTHIKCSFLQVNIIPSYIFSRQHANKLHFFKSHFYKQHYYRSHFYKSTFLQVNISTKHLHVYSHADVDSSFTFHFFIQGRIHHKLKRQRNIISFSNRFFLAPRTCPSSSRRPSRRPRSCEV